jgi:DoxX-like family
MQTATQMVRVSKKGLWTGRVLSGIVSAFLLFDCVMKFSPPAAAYEGMAHLGWPMKLSIPLGCILLISVVVYLIPRTAVLGAILLTGYLGGAVATNLRVGDPLISHILAPVYVGIVLWSGLYLRDERLRNLIPLRG